MLEIRGDTLKKKILLGIILLLGIGFCFYTYFSIPKSVDSKIPDVIDVIDKTEENIDYNEVINNLREQYNNSDIIGIIKIPELLEEVIVQSSDNDYYLNHDLYKNYSINGATFLDFRNSFRDSKKLLIYGHSDPDGLLPFVKITGYNKETFFNNHPYIYITDSSGIRKYEVFSSYIEAKDFDYVNLESFSGLTYKEHLLKLKKKSFVKHKIELDEDSHILILQTCSFDSRVKQDTKFQIIIAKEIEYNNK